jgi:Nif-specific regulatory protein
VRRGGFREDLYRCLSRFTLNVPPLRERQQDVEPLAAFFLEAFGTLHGKPGIGLAAEARERLLRYHWPGNVRQLRSLIDHAVSIAAGAQIEASELLLPPAVAADISSLRIEDWERHLIAEALARTGGNVPQAASLLGIGRATLYRKCEEYGIQRNEK